MERALHPVRRMYVAFRHGTVGFALAYAVTVAACEPGARSHHDPDCMDGVSRCNANNLETCTGGAFVTTETCALACDPALGCVHCVPGTGTCDGNTSHACTADGSAVVDVECDPVQGMACDAATGLCSGACAPQNLGKNYMGCDFYATVTANTVDSNFHFAVAIANSTSSFAHVTIEGGALAASQTATVTPLGVQVVALPWVDALKGSTCHGSALGCGAITTPAARVTNGAYRIRSDQPVSVYQFNALEYQIGSQRSYTNDASLLAPVTTMTGRYFAVTLPAWDTGGSWPTPSPGLLAITATTDGTDVTLTTTADTPASGGAPAFSAGASQTVTLGRGDVLQVTAGAGDLTGSRVTANHPVQLVAGHYCTNVPSDVGHCDHLEQSMFPLETLANDYLIAAPVTASLPDGKVEIVRIVATEPGTNLTFDPPQSGVPTTIANAGEFVEVPSSAASFRVTANKKILVAQFMEGSLAGGNEGDPSMCLAVATQQFRSEYVFHVPATYIESYLAVIAPPSASVLLDGNPLVQASDAIGGSGYAVTRQQIASGNHVVTSSVPVGVSVYGYAPDTSYWYPGGLDLNAIVVQ